MAIIDPDDALRLPHMTESEILYAVGRILAQPTEHLTDDDKAHLSILNDELAKRGKRS